MRLCRMFAGIVLAGLFATGVAMGDTVTAPIEGEGEFTSGSAPSDTLKVDAGAKTIKATEAKKNTGAADSQITVVTGEGSNVVHVADVANRGGESSYTVKGVYVGARGAGGNGQEATWSAEFKSVAVKVTGLTIFSGASKDGLKEGTDWAAVKSSTHVAIAQVTIEPDTDAAALAVVWTGGEAIAGQPKKRKISLAEATKRTVTATGTDAGPSSKSLNVWPVWATITIKMDGETPTFARQFGILYDLTEGLGLKEFQIYGGTTTVVAKVIPVATLDPFGVGDILLTTTPKDGRPAADSLKFLRKRQARIWANGVADNTPQFGTTPPDEWMDDNTEPFFQNMEPFFNKVYDRDAPTVGETTVATNRCEGHTRISDRI